MGGHCCGAARLGAACQGLCAQSVRRLRRSLPKLLHHFRSRLRGPLPSPTHPANMLCATTAAICGSHASSLSVTAPQRLGSTGRAAGGRLVTGPRSGRQAPAKLAPRAAGKDKQAQETVTGVVFEPFKGRRAV